MWLRGLFRMATSARFTAPHSVGRALQVLLRTDFCYAHIQGIGVHCRQVVCLYVVLRNVPHVASLSCIYVL